MNLKFHENEFPSKEKWPESQNSLPLAPIFTNIHQYSPYIGMQGSKNDSFHNYEFHFC
jgi:hypothetical protein